MDLFLKSSRNFINSFFTLFSFKYFILCSIKISFAINFSNTSSKNKVISPLCFFSEINFSYKLIFDLIFFLCSI